MGKVLWKIIVTGAIILSSMASRKMLDAGWKKTKNEEPPQKTKGGRSGLSKAILWAVFTGMVVSITRFFTRRGAEKGWEKATGDTPPAEE